MPRWPDKEKVNLELVKPEQEEAEAVSELDQAEIANQKLQVARYTDLLWNRIDALFSEVETLNANLANLKLLEAQPASEHSAIKLQRRRTEDEMRYALRVFANGLPRQRDDEHEQVLEDAIGELLSLRQITMDLMQSMATAHQNGLAAIRKLTER